MHSRLGSKILSDNGLGGDFNALVQYKKKTYEYNSQCFKAFKKVKDSHKSNLMFSEAQKLEILEDIRIREAKLKEKAKVNKMKHKSNLKKEKLTSPKRQKDFETFSFSHQTGEKNKPDSML